MLVAELDGEARLDELAVQRPLLVADVEVADELLRDRGAALDRAAGADVVVRGAGDALEVDAAVLVEAPILDCDRRLAHPGLISLRLTGWRFFSAGIEPSREPSAA